MATTATAALLTLAIAAPMLCLAQANYTNFRVTTGLSDRSPSLVRVSFVQPFDAPPDAKFESYFSYNSRFKYRWLANKVSTGLFNVTPGQANAVQIPGAPALSINVPQPGEGVRGIMTGDICYSSPIAKCQEGEHDEILSHMTTILNDVMKYPGDMSFWSLIGDNFYDETGGTSSAFWNELSTETKSKIFYSVPGNWDFWNTGVPTDINRAIDQFGNGWCQYHGMDALSSAADARQPWNFTNNPDEDGPSSASAASSSDSVSSSSSSNSDAFVPGRQYLADVSNFEYVTQVGNLGIIGYSGAHDVTATAPFLEYACSWIGSRLDTIDWIILMGHWAVADKGANAASYTPAVYNLVTQLSGCDTPGMVKYFAGHEHCNRVEQTNTGFIVGGFGKSEHKKCNEFGIPMLDSTGGRLLVAYFPISELIVPTEEGKTVAAEATQMRLKGAKDRYAALTACLAKQPLSGCINQLEVNIWMNVSTTDRMGLLGR